MVQKKLTPDKLQMQHSDADDEDNAHFVEDSDISPLMKGSIQDDHTFESKAMNIHRLQKSQIESQFLSNNDQKLDVVDPDYSAYEAMHDNDSSEIFDTDSSEECRDGDDEILLTQVAQEEQLPEETKVEEEETQREEMGGILVYDAYARMKGCEKIEQYFEDNVPTKIQTDILFTKAEAKEVSKDLFGDQARARDFVCDLDRNYFRNLPRFLPQRDYLNLKYTLPIPPQQNVLIFDSRFENGNLRKAAKVSNIEYNLWLENDMNTKGHTQWYYFKIVYKDIALHADKKTHKIKFNILNLAKTSSLYQQGMKPCIFSKKRNLNEKIGWFKGGDDITYKQNAIPRYDNQANPPKQMGNNFLMNQNGAGEGVDFYYTFSFTYDFESNVEDELYFAHAVPYTYTNMQEKLLELRQNPSYEPYMKMNIMCLTLGKNPVPLITITENIGSYLDYYEEMRLMHQIPNIVKKAFRQKYQKVKKLARQGEDSKGRVKRLLEAAFEEEIKCFFEYNEDHFLTTSPLFAGFGTRLSDFIKIHGEKKAIIITSRVHPGEPQASHMLDGLIKYLLSKEAEELRKHFVIRIVPMLNPDGVIYGNYRCSLLGCDLNRKWEKPNRLLHPTIFHSKNLIRHLHGERKVVLYCDLHGHSRKKNAFFYGCSFKNYEQEGRIKNAQSRIIPLLCCQKNNLFSLKDCRFGMEKSKESTGRVVVFKEMNIMNSFTLECSFFGKEWKSQTESVNKSSKKKLMHMSLTDYNSLGETLIQVMRCYLPSEQSKLQFISGKILDVFYDEFIKFIPPYILKREEEKRKKAEKEAMGKGIPTNQNQALIRRIKPSQPSGGRSNGVENGNQGSRTKTNQQKKRQDSQRRASEVMPRNNLFAMNEERDSSRNDEYDRQADRSAATKTKVAIIGIDGEVSSDQKMIHGHSSKDDTDHFNSMINIPNNQNEIMEFEFFMNGIQNNLKDKEEKQKKKLESILDKIVSKGNLDEESKAKIRMGLLQSDSDSSDSSGGDSPEQRQKKKLKMQKKQRMLDKMIKKVEEKIKKKKEAEEEEQKNHKEESKNEERKVKMPSKMELIKNKEFKKAIFNHQASRQESGTPDLQPTANFIAKKKSRIIKEEPSNQTMQPNYTFQFNTSVLQQVPKNEAQITRQKQTQSNQYRNDEPRFSRGFYDNPVKEKMLEDSRRKSNFDLRAEEILNSQPAKSSSSKRNDSDKEIHVNENSVQEEAWHRSFNKGSPRHPNMAREFIISGSSNNKRQLNFNKKQQQIQNEPRKLGTAGDGVTRPAESAQGIRDQTQSSHKQLIKNDANSSILKEQKSQKTMMRVDLVKNHQSVQKLQNNKSNVMKPQRQFMPITNNRQNPMMQGVSMIQVQQLSHHQTENQNDASIMLEKMQQELIIKGKKGIDPLFQQVGINGHSIQMNLIRQQPKKINKNPSGQSLNQKTGVVNKSPSKIYTGSVSNSKNASMNNYNEIIAKVRMNRIGQSSDKRSNHPYTQQSKISLMDSRSEKDINITYNSQHFRKSAESEQQREQVKQQPGTNRNSVLSSGLQIQKNQGQSTLHSQTSVQGLPLTQVSSLLTPNQVTMAIRQEQNKQNMMRDLIRQLQSDQSPQMKGKPMTQQQLLFNNLQQELYDGSYGTSEDQTSENQRNMLIQFISQHYQNSQQVMHKRQGYPSAYRGEEGNSFQIKPFAVPESPQIKRFAPSQRIDDYYSGPSQMINENFIKHDESRSGYGGQFNSIKSRKCAYDSPEVIKGKRMALEAQSLKMDMSADHGYKQPPKPPSRFTKGSTKY